MPRKTNFETVPVAKLAHLAVRESTDSDSAPTILSISRQRDLLLTRELILSRAGYRVCSALTLEEAIRECAHVKFDLVMIGHSFLNEEALAMQFFCEALGNAGPSTGTLNGGKQPGATPVLLLRRPEDARLQGAAYELDPLSGPEALLATVNGILGRVPRSDGNGKS
jgi:PleD family two-component response regulator